MRIAIDIDSTLHHYWDQLDAVARRRFGVALPYAEQATWEIGLLEPEQVRAAVAETHEDDHVLAAVHDGDEITIDVDGRRLDVALSDEEIAARVAAYESPEPPYKSGVMAKYARLVSSAAEGAVTG